MYQQLKLDLEEKITYDFENYDWLIGNPVSLKIFFIEELKRIDLKPKARSDCLKRLRELRNN